MSGPGYQGGWQPQQPDQAYSQAMHLPTPPRGAVAPGPVPPAPLPPAPPRKPGSGRNAVLAVVAIAAVVALIAALVVAALLSDSNGSSGSGSDTVSASDPSVALFRVNDCLYDVPEEPKVGDCDNGGSPYKVTQVMPVGESCKPSQTSFSNGRAYCLTPNLNVNYCYTTPVPGTWIKAAARCGAPGTIAVVSVVPGFMDPSRCSGQGDVSYGFDDPVYTICAKSYT